MSAACAASWNRRAPASASACCVAWAIGWKPVVTERVHSLRGLLLRRLWLPLLVLLLCSAIGSFALARFYAGQVYDRWLLDSAMSLSELVKVQDGRASIEITPAVSRMFTWDNADEVHGEVVDAAGGRL